MVASLLMAAASPTCKLNLPGQQQLLSQSQSQASQALELQRRQAGNPAYSSHPAACCCHWLEAVCSASQDRSSTHEVILQAKGCKNFSICHDRCSSAFQTSATCGQPDLRRAPKSSTRTHAYERVVQPRSAALEFVCFAATAALCTRPASTMHFGIIPKVNSQAFAACG